MGKKITEEEKVSLTLRQGMGIESIRDEKWFNAAINMYMINIRSTDYAVLAGELLDRSKLDEFISFTDRENNWVILNLIIGKESYTKALIIKDLAIVGFKNTPEHCFKNDSAARFMKEVNEEESTQIIKAYEFHREILRRAKRCN